MDSQELPRRRPITPMIVGAFYFLASLICAAAGLSLLLPRGGFDWMWAIKPTAYQQLFAINGLADASRVLAGEVLEGLIGVIVGWGNSVFAIAPAYQTRIREMKSS